MCILYVTIDRDREWKEIKINRQKPVSKFSNPGLQDRWKMIEMRESFAQKHRHADCTMEVELFYKTIYCN